MNSEETIVAISTPHGRSGLGVVRVSGKEALHIAGKIVAERGSCSKGQPKPVTLTPWHAVLVEIFNGSDGSLLDEAIVTYFKEPKSYTGEDLVEFSCHGSPVVLEQVIQLAMQHGARMAEPGEFTLRAFLRGRIDLVQAEAIQDLIEAKTRYQAQVAIQQTHGSLSRTLAPIKGHLVDLVSLLEAGIDFAEDDVSVLEDATILARLEKLLREVSPILESYHVGRMIREGISLAIVGRPNVGKSSLFNRLLSTDRAIVTEIPGTTRDLISEVAQIHGVPIRLVDTAGIRESHDIVEREGVARSYATLAESDLVILVLDASQPWEPTLGELIQQVLPLKHVMVLNKCDLEVQLRIPSSGLSETPIIRVSAKTGDGLEALQKTVIELATGRSALEASAQSMITNLRHQQLLSECQRKLRSALENVGSSQPHEVLLLDLYGALRALDTITGATSVEDILGNIFSRFCIGK